MKIVQLNVTANWGSTGKIVEGISSAVKSSGGESHIAYGRYANPCESTLIKVGRQSDVYFHFLQEKILNREGLASRKPTKKLIEKLEEIQPDIIHLHNIHDHWLNYPLLFEYLKSINIPIVWTFHDCWAFTGCCKYFDSLNCNEWRNGCVRCPIDSVVKRRSNLNYNLKKEFINSLGSKITIVPVSAWLEDFCKQSFLSGTRIQRIYNGIDTNVFKPSSKKENYVLGVALPWSKRKGLDDFIKLREILNPEIGIKLVGLSKSQLKGLPDGIEGMQRTHNINELATLYSNAIAFVNPTYEDNFPTVNIEALASGTPVITYKTGGCPEAVDNDTGLVVDKGDVSGLATAINVIFNEPEASRREKCRKRAVSNFNQDIQFNKYVDLYEELLDN